MDVVDKIRPGDLIEQGGDLERPVTRPAGPFRLLALDIDGTLLRSDKTISPRARGGARRRRERRA